MVWGAKTRQVWLADHPGGRVLALEGGSADKGYELQESKSPTVCAPRGLALHPDGRRLFVTSSRGFRFETRPSTPAQTMRAGEYLCIG